MKGPINKVIYFTQEYLLSSYYAPEGVLDSGNTSIKQDRQVTHS